MYTEPSFVAIVKCPYSEHTLVEMHSIGPIPESTRGNSKIFGSCFGVLASENQFTLDT